MYYAYKIFFLFVKVSKNLKSINILGCYSKGEFIWRSTHKIQNFYKQANTRNKF